MGQSLSNNCIGDTNNVYEPTTYVAVQSKKNSLVRNNSDNLNTPSYNNQPFSRKPSFVRFVETINKELKICEMCNYNDNSLIQFNQCIECGNYHCGFHRRDYHK